MTTPVRRAGSSSSAGSSSGFPSALDTATYAVTQLEDNPLFNSGHGAVFTRDGINELEASVMVSRGHAKRGVGVLGLRRVKNPILLAKAMLEHGDDDLYGGGRAKERAASSSSSSSSSSSIDAIFPTETTIGGARTVFVAPGTGPHRCGDGTTIDAPSAQGHTQIFGKTAEVLARRYGLEMVHPRYFFTQARWDEHVRALESEKAGRAAVGTWSADEYLPQGTCGTVALDADGIVCAATSTGGMTNKLTGRIGDTPCVGAGFWAEEWAEDGDPAGRAARGGGSMWDRAQELIRRPGPMLQLSDTLAGLLADCFPSPALYSPVPPSGQGQLTTTRCVGMSGTGNGDSFLRVAAVHTVAAIAHFTGVPSAEALRRIAGTGGELEKSAGDRWRKTGEGEGGVIGIECAVVRDGEGNVVETRSHILQDYNCAGMYRAFIDDDGKAVVRIWRDDMTLPLGKGYEAEGRAEWVGDWVDEKEMLKTRE